MQPQARAPVTLVSTHGLIPAECLRSEGDCITVRSELPLEVGGVYEFRIELEAAGISALGCLIVQFPMGDSLWRARILGASQTDRQQWGAWSRAHAGHRAPAPAPSQTARTLHALAKAARLRRPPEEERTAPLTAAPAR